MSSRLSTQHSALRAESALIIFAKAPIPGQVKTRLCPPLTPDEAASLHGSFVLDALERSAFDVRRSRRDAPRSRPNRTSNAADRFVACAPSASHVFFKIIEARHGVRLLDQTGEDLGSRMAHAFRTIFDRGYQRVLVVGTDLPSLPGECYTQAFSLLADHDLVLGPSLDGGYYLIGLTRPVPELFAGIPWSTDRVFPLTRAKAETLGLKTGLLPAWRDVDTVDDLVALIQEAGLGDRQGRSPLAPCLSARTAGALRLLAGRLRTRPGTAKTAGL